MECFPEVTYAIFVDGELPAEEAQRVRAHLSGCVACRATVAALTAENKMLVASFAHADAPELAPHADTARPAWLELLAVAAVLALIGVVVHWINGQTSEAVNWLNPFTSEGRNNLAFNMVFYFSHGGAQVVEHLASIVGWIVLAIATVFGVFALARSQNRFRSGLSLIALTVAFCLPGQAIETRSSKGILSIPQNETINDTLFASGESIEIDGTVNGDLFTASRSVVVHGNVTGNVFAWSQSVEVDGKVGGSIFTFCQNALIRGTVGHSVYSWVEFLRLEPGSQVTADVVAGSQQADLSGKINGGIITFAGLVNVHGDIGRNVLAYVGEMNLNSPTHIGGGLTANVHRRDNVRIADGVTIAGPTDIRIRRHQSRYTRPGFYIWHAILLVGAFIVGWIAMYVFPGFFQNASRTVGTGWRTFGLGFAVLVGTPIAIVLIAISLIGLPLALVTLALYCVALYGALIFVANFVGGVLFKDVQPRSGQALLAYFVGLLILTVLFHLPFIGGILEFLGFCLGLGALVWTAYRVRREKYLVPGT
jgi:Putative zinc-finger